MGRSGLIGNWAALGCGTLACQAIVQEESAEIIGMKPSTRISSLSRALGGRRKAESGGGGGCW